MPKVMQRQTHTQEWLQQALLELMQEKDYSAITIQEITERADIARITFYRHYTTKEELLLDSLEHIYSMFLEQFAAMDTQKLVMGELEEPPMLPLFQHIADNRKLYRAILEGQVAAIVHKRLREFATDIITRNLRRIITSDIPLPLDVLATHIAVAQLGMVQWWLENDTPYDVVYLARQSYQLVLFGVQRFIANRE
jgi:AcrR family transcriptional regulator